MKTTDKHIIDTDTARTLLARWYDGATSAEEEDALTLYFTHAEDIPEDMAADAAIFAMPTATSDKMSAVIPADLLAEVNGAIISEKIRKRRRSIRYIAASAAACVCVALALGINGNSDLHDTSSDKPYIAEVKEDSPKPTKTDTTISASQIKESMEAETKAEAPKHTTPTYAAAQTPQVKDDYIEITDPEEAAKLQQEIAEMLSKNIDKSSHATRRALRQAKNITEQTNSSNAEAVARIINNSISNL